MAPNAYGGSAPGCDLIVGFTEDHEKYPIVEYWLR